MGTDQKHQDTQDDGGPQKKKIPILAPAGASKQDMRSQRIFWTENNLQLHTRSEDPFILQQGKLQEVPWWYNRRYHLIPICVVLWYTPDPYRSMGTETQTRLPHTTTSAKHNSSLFCESDPPPQPSPGFQLLNKLLTSAKRGQTSLKSPHLADPLNNYETRVFAFL
jgi:hypothetical protein